MSAMKIIEQVKQAGGRITAFRSYCGGIPAPDSNDNPWGYKFSWSPIGVLRAATNAAHYLKNGKEVQVASGQVFFDTHNLDIEGVGEFEAYPNRNSLDYVNVYGLSGISTMFRGTLRYKGWSETMRYLVDLGLLDSQEQQGLATKTWPDLLAERIGAQSSQHIKEKVASYLWLTPDSPVIRRLEWLGLFSEKKLSRDMGSIIELLSEAMLEKMAYAPQDRDMIVMHHEFVADYGQRQERLTSTLIDFGIPGDDSSMARTVSLPVAIAVRMILEGKIAERGVHIPVRPSLFQPIMDELATLGIAMKERSYAF
jgi:saccharopine dehydrogenase (NADP+, L-glutamate forming)/spermidine synthase